MSRVPGLVRLRVRAAGPAIPHWFVNKSATYYEVLGVHRLAGRREIRSAFRKLATIWHPDKCKIPQAKKIFQRINEAHEVLIDPVKRKKYDATLPVPIDPPRAETVAAVKIEQPPLLAAKKTAPPHPGIVAYKRAIAPEPSEPGKVIDLKA